LSHRIREHGLEVVAVGSGAVPFATGLTLLHREPEQAALARERLHELIVFAAAVGAPLVTIGGFRGRLAASGDGAREELVDALRTGAEDAARHGLRLALEPLNRYEADVVNTAEEGLGLVDEVGHGALGLLLDTFHVNIEEASWTEPFRRLIEAGKLWHVHIGDNNRLPPGRGLIDFRAIVGALAEAGYQGALSGELLVGDDPDQAAYETVTFLDQLLSRGEV
jgi:sugar phosphate isomerase/epimerase